MEDGFDPLSVFVDDPPNLAEVIHLTYFEDLGADRRVC